MNTIAINNFKDKYWDNYTGGLKTIVQLVLYMAFYLFFNYEIAGSNSIISFIALGIFMVGLFYKLYKTVEYRTDKGKYLFFATKNDLYIKITRICLGFALMASAITMKILNTDVSYLFVVILLLISLIILLNGIYAMPNGVIYVADGKLRIANSKFKVSEVKVIAIKASRILVTSKNDKKERVDNLDINHECGECIRNYILSKTGNVELVVLNEIVLE